MCWVSLLCLPATPWRMSFLRGWHWLVKMARVFGFINRLGQTVIPALYLSATRFEGGLAVAAPVLVDGVANTQGAVAYIDRMGRNIFGETTFGVGQPFAEGLGRANAIGQIRLY